MQWYHWTMAIAALFTAIISARLGLRRSLLWIGALTADFIISVGYLHMPKPSVPGGWWPPASGIAALTDAAVCIAIYSFGKRRWETAGLYSLMLLSVAVNLLYTTGSILGFPPIPPHEVYADILEAINYLALLLILGTALLSRVGATDGHPFASRVVAALYSARGAVFAKHRPSEALRKKQ